MGDRSTAEAVNEVLKHAFSYDINSASKSLNKGLSDRIEQ